MERTDVFVANNRLVNLANADVWPLIDLAVLYKLAHVNERDQSVRRNEYHYG